jgi:Tol biopolymer transport system component
VKSRATKPLIKRDDPNTFLLDPSVSPDNTLIAYVSQPPPRVVGGRPDRGSDLWVAKRDGSNPHAVFTHVTPNQLVSSPQWEDSTHLLAAVQEITQQNGTTNVIYNLERIEVATGVRAVVLNDVLAFGLSPNRKRVVYAHLAHPSGETLEAVDLAGGTPITLIDLSQNLQPFNSPRFSREGTAIAFASAEQTGARADATYVMAPRFGSPTRATNDGLPEDIWIVPAAGGAARRVADVKEDLPALTWSGDDRHIFVLGASALYDVALGSGAVDPIGPGSFHGQLTWTP